MNPEERIRSVVERKVQALTRYPSMGQGTAVTRVRVREGYSCEIEDGRWTLRADQTEKSGGQGDGPDPGVLLRAALGSCLAMGYVRWAAWLGVPLAGLEVEVQADYDARGQYGVAAVPPGYTEVRYVVSIESEAPEHEIRQLLDTADAHSPYLDVFRRAQQLRREVRLRTPSQA